MSLILKNIQKFLTLSLLFSIILFSTVSNISLEDSIEDKNKNNSKITTYYLSRQNENKIIEVSENEVFQIKIAGNPTTGYEWNIIKSNLISNQFKIVSLDDKITGKYYTNYSDDKDRKGIVGVGGYYYFTFKALSNGIANIKFEYKRSWENDNIDELIAQIKIDEKVKGSINDIDANTNNKNLTSLYSNFYKFTAINFIFLCMLTWLF